MENLPPGQNHQSHYNGEVVTDVKATTREALQKYLHYLPWFILSLIIFIGGTYLYLHYTTPLYSTSLNILVKTDNDQANDVSNKILAELTGSGRSNIANELRIIKTNTLMEKVVRKNNLDVTYYSLGKVRNVELHDRKDTPFV